MTHGRYWSDEEEEYSPIWPDTCSICMSDKHLLTIEENPPNYLIQCGNCGYEFWWVRPNE